MPELTGATLPSDSAMAPNDPTARSAKPMNEADDFELMRYFQDVLAPQALLAWSAASAETKRLLTHNGTPQQIAAAIANAWSGAINKVDSCKELAEHMLWRAESLRIQGILSGDPREAKFLSVVPEEMR